MPSRRYLLITPCRDEAAYLSTTIETVAAQTVKPARWIIVDDGSTDDTPDILAKAARGHDFITVVTRADRGSRIVGAGVIDAFYAGLDQANLDEYDYICKLDGDLELPSRYFQTLMERFEAESCLGNMSGKSYVRENDHLYNERLGDENAIGAAKFYRVECFRQIGGFIREVSWDGIDGHLCRMNGWIAQSVDEEPLHIVHLRRMGSSQRSLWRGRLRWGRGKWFMGSAWYFILAVAVYRMMERPFIIGGLGILLGYMQAALRRDRRYDDRTFRKHLRRYELASLLRGKRRAMCDYHQRIQKEAARHRTASSPSRTGSGTRDAETRETVANTADP